MNSQKSQLDFDSLLEQLASGGWWSWAALRKEITPGAVLGVWRTGRKVLNAGLGMCRCAQALQYQETEWTREGRIAKAVFGGQVLQCRKSISEGSQDGN